MNRNTRLLGIALVGVAALLLPLNADASCGTGLSFGAYYTALSGTTNGPSLRANFWVLDAGVPAVGPGIDNGGQIETDSWVVPYTNGPTIRGDWAVQTTYDGCPNTLPNAGTSSMVFSMSDVDGTGNMTFAVACVTRNPQAGVQYNLDLPPGCGGGNCAPITLIQAPRAVISNSVRTAGTNDVTITVASPTFSGPATGFYSDGSANCTATAAIPQYDVYRQQTARDVPPSPSLDAGPWVLAATCAIGTPCTLPAIASPTNTDIVLATSPHFNSNFTTGEAATGAAARVGQKSLKITAGPVIAVTPKPKVVPNPRTQAPGQQNQQ
jgi:hypothetical protein